MINIIELRVGNVILSPDTNKPVVVELNHLQAIKGGVKFNDRYYEPIPLTPEILDKAGFVSKLHPNYIGDGNRCIGEFYSEKNSMSLMKIESSTGKSYYRMKIKNDIGIQDVYVELKYLHQLQNLYFTLTGNE